MKLNEAEQRSLLSELERLRSNVSESRRNYYANQGVYEDYCEEKAQELSERYSDYDGKYVGIRFYSGRAGEGEKTSYVVGYFHGFCFSRSITDYGGIRPVLRADDGRGHELLRKVDIMLIGTYEEMESIEVLPRKKRGVVR